MFKKVKRFFQETWVELSKVTWPSRSEVVSSTVVILVMCLVMAVVIGAFDFGISKIVEWILSLG